MYYKKATTGQSVQVEIILTSSNEPSPVARGSLTFTAKNKHIAKLIQASLINRAQ